MSMSIALLFTASVVLSSLEFSDWLGLLHLSDSSSIDADLSRRKNLEDLEFVDEIESRERHNLAQSLPQRQ